MATYKKAGESLRVDMVKHVLSDSGILGVSKDTLMREQIPQPNRAFLTRTQGQSAGRK